MEAPIEEEMVPDVPLEMDPTVHAVLIMRESGATVRGTWARA